jgi:hypothetical protein
MCSCPFTDEGGQRRNPVRSRDPIKEEIPKGNPEFATGLFETGEGVPTASPKVAAGTAADLSLRRCIGILPMMYVELRFFLRRRGLFVLLQVRLEVPDLGADRLLVLPMLLIEWDELVNETFGMDKAKPVRQDIELTGIVTDDSERLGNAPLV